LPQNEGESDGSIAVKWQDGAHAKISGSVRYDLPTDEANMIKIHTTFGSQKNLEKALIQTNIERSIYMTGPLLTAKESYAERRNDIISYIEDQASRGVYKTKTEAKKKIDELSGEEKTVDIVSIVTDDKGNYKRQEKSPIAEMGIKLYNVAIKEIVYDGIVEKQIQTQQQSLMQVNTAIADAKRAEQEAITTEAEGKASAAKAKWEQEVIKAKTVTQAEAQKEVAKLEVETAELNKRRDILKAQGEAEAKKLVMAADGALQAKLDAWLKERQYAWQAFANAKQPLVPTIISGGGAGANVNSAQFIEMMGLKAMKDLSLEMKTK
jgi:regulator of protease activity HflC (stomatin/prohibitin superfamily)